MSGGHYSAQSAPVRFWKAVTPSDSVNLPAGVRRVYATGAGNIAMVDPDGTVGVFAFAAGEMKEIGPVRINSTSTTATGIIALY
jgi:hypothetical protein